LLVFWFQVYMALVTGRIGKKTRASLAQRPGRATKLYIPLPPKIVLRPRLIEQLDETASAGGAPDVTAGLTYDNLSICRNGFLVALAVLLETRYAHGPPGTGVVHEAGNGTATPLPWPGERTNA
jgi:hypothetical protein